MVDLAELAPLDRGVVEIVKSGPSPERIGAGGGRVDQHGRSRTGDEASLLPRGETRRAVRLRPMRLVSRNHLLPEPHAG